MGKPWPTPLPQEPRKNTEAILVDINLTNGLPLEPTIPLASARSRAHPTADLQQQSHLRMSQVRHSVMELEHVYRAAVLPCKVSATREHSGSEGSENLGSYEEMVPKVLAINCDTGSTSEWRFLVNKTFGDAGGLQDPP